MIDQNEFEVPVWDLIKQDTNSASALVFRWSLARTHEARIAVLEEMLDQCYNRLTENRQHFHALSEDQLTVQVVTMLQQMGVYTEHDPQIGGHCDIVVRSKDQFIWIGEAKKYSNYVKLADGFLQLSTRYAVAAPGRDRGEVIIYFSNPDAMTMMRTWSVRLIELCAGVSITKNDLDDGSLCFRTRHTCPTSGANFYVRHRAVPLHFGPKK